MKETNVTKEKRIIMESRGNKECIYYIALFAVSLVAAAGLLVFSILKTNPGLMMYSCVLLPTFALALLISIIIYVNSKNPIYVKKDELCVKGLFFTKKIPFAKLNKITVSTNGKSNTSIVKISYGEKAVRYKYKNLSSETALLLRKLTK